MMTLNPIWELSPEISHCQSAEKPETGRTDAYHPVLFPGHVYERDFPKDKTARGYGENKDQKDQDEIEKNIREGGDLQ